MYAMMKATDHCNLRCKYCYVPEEQRRKQGYLTVEQMPTLFRKMFDWQQSDESAGHLEVCWSGGEMLSLPLPWWEDMFRIQQMVHQSGRYTFRLSNSIQTNFTLMDEERLNLLTRNNVNIGMSLDGPKECMDQTRVFTGGASAFDVIVEKLIRFREKRSFKPGVILVLSRANVGLIDKVWEFFNDLRMGFQINTYHFAPSSALRHEDNAITAREYLDAMCHLFDLWSERTDSIDIANFRRATNFLLQGKVEVCHDTEACSGRFYMVRWTGDVFPCNEFSGADFEQQYCFGNLLTDDWRAIRDHRTRTMFLDRDKKVLADAEQGERCRRCRYWKGCHAGCFHCALKGQYRAQGDCRPEVVVNLPDREHCEAKHGLYSYIEKKIQSQAQKHQVPVFLYPDRVSPQKEGRRKAFYQFQEEVVEMSSPELAFLSWRLDATSVVRLRCHLGNAQRILAVCCGTVLSEESLLEGLGQDSCVTSVDHRRQPEEAEDHPMGTRVSQEYCEDIPEWSGWQEGPQWDAILVALPYIAADDLPELMRRWAPCLRTGGVVILFAHHAWLQQERHVDLVELPGLDGGEKELISVNVGGLSLVTWEGSRVREAERDGAHRVCEQGSPVLA